MCRNTSDILSPRVFYNSYGCTTRLQPAWPSVSFYTSFADPSTSTKTWGLLLRYTPRGTDNGCHRFDRSSVHSSCTVVGCLKCIRVPTLFSSVHGIARGFVVQPFLDHIPQVTPAELQHSNHT